MKQIQQPATIDQLHQQRKAGITIFTIPKPFNGHTGIIQRNAIKSWLVRDPLPEVILFGNETGVAEIARDLAVRHIPDIKVNEFGTPLIDFVFDTAQTIAATPFVAYVNTDIILLGSFFTELEKLQTFDKPALVVGRRSGLMVWDTLDYGNPDWEKELAGAVRKHGLLDASSGIDYFAFPTGFYRSIPPFAVGRTCWDNWLLWKARQDGAALVDASRRIIAIHQEHPYTHAKGGAKEIWNGIEAQRNIQLAQGKMATIRDADYCLDEAGIVPMYEDYALPETMMQDVFDFKYRQSVEAYLRNENETALDLLDYIRLWSPHNIIPEGYRPHLAKVTLALGMPVMTPEVDTKAAGDQLLEKALARIVGRDQQLPSKGRYQEKTKKQSDSYYESPRYEVAELVSETAARILDVGCGAGVLGAFLKQRQGAEVWGVEYVPAVAAAASGKLDRVIPGKVEDALPQLPDSYFDVIVCADVLEHLVDPWQVLTELRDKLAPGGELVASIPNVRHWTVLSGLLQGEWRYEEAGILDRTHLRFFTWNSCVRMFDDAGFAIESGGATLLNNDTAFPETAVKELRKVGFNVDTLIEESRHYQFLIVAAPKKKKADLTSIVMLTWNQLPFTQACLESIAKHTTEPYELIVVDNGSTDGTVVWLRRQAENDPRIRIIENQSNRGFAAGCNQGIAAAEGDYLLLLNNDTVVTPGWLSGMLELFERYPDTGIVGPMTNRASGVQVIAEAGYRSQQELPVWAEKFREQTRYRVIPQHRIVGFCMLFRRELVDKIGLLDEAFGSGNFEDDDYCRRAELAGYRNLIVGDVFIHHEGGASFAGNKVDYARAIQRNFQHFRSKWSSAVLDEQTLRRWLVIKVVEKSERLTQRGDLDAAVKTLLEQGIRTDSAAALPYVALAELLINAGRCQDALEVLSEMPSAMDNALKLELAALCHCALGEDIEARQAAEQIADRSRACVVLGILAARQGGLDDAERLFRKAIDLDPSCGSGWLSLGMLLWGQERQTDAWQTVLRSVVVDPLDGRALQIMQDMAERTGRMHDALTAIEQAVNAYPDSRLLAKHHVQLLAMIGLAERALAACETFLVNFGADDELLETALQLRGKAGAYDRVSAGGAGAISLCMIVKDEQSCLAACLASAKPAVHEMIVVDTGSSDHTVAIATVFGARVLGFPWNGSFSDARNHGLEEAKGGWILSLDADEVLSAHDYQVIQDTVNMHGADNVAWRVLTRNYTTKVHAQGWTANDGAYPLQEKAEGWHPSWKVRLFPNRRDVRFNGEVHEMVEDSLQVQQFDIRQATFVVHHYGALEEDEQKSMEKRQRYFDIGITKLEKNPDDLTAICELAVQAGELGLFDQGLALWDRILAVAPDTVEALFNKGYCLMGLQRYAEALELSRRVLTLEPDHKEAAFNYGSCELYAGEAQRALDALAPIARKHLDYPPLNAILTALSLGVGDVARAKQCLEALTSRNYAITDYIRERIVKLRELGKHDTANHIATNAVKINLHA